MTAQPVRCERRHLLQDGGCIQPSSDGTGLLPIVCTPAQPVRDTGEGRR